ncbi:MAG: hypothetical protein UGF89_01265 [Acutalibacteraceae bacterium]|nr:hypothetical protein [Acutalibacteraceae bacterium]
MRKCDSCGKLYQESKDVFCPHCGAVAQKQCTHSSSFDSRRYDRGEIYKNSNPQYKNTTYNKGFEPHVQRNETPDNKSQTNDAYGDKIPQLNLPDFKKAFSKIPNGKFIGIIVFVVIIVFNALTAFINDDVNGTDYSESASEGYIDEYINELYTVVDKATIEMVDSDEDFKTFTLEISGIGFDDYLPENMQNEILSGTMAEEILSDNTFVEMLICDFSKEIVEEQSYNNTLNNSYCCSGEQIDGKCKYEFTYSFDYDEIVHIASGINFYLGDGRRINAELPFSAFSVSEDGEIIYYTSYADSETAWNTVFSECSNEQEINRDLCIDFDAVEIVKGE